MLPLARVKMRLRSNGSRVFPLIFHYIRINDGIPITIIYRGRTSETFEGNLDLTDMFDLRPR